MLFRGSLTLWVALSLAGVGIAVQAQPKSAERFVFQCIDNQGRTLTADRLIAQCNDREQKVITQEGVVMRTIPPSMTASERAVVEARVARERALEDSRAEDTRRDRQLLRRFSSENSHNRARDASLEPAMAANRISKQRLLAIDDERKPLFAEAEFFKNKPLPVKLKQQFDGIDATEAALHTAMKAQREEMARVNENYDIELERLRKLWAGAQSGLLGPMRVAAGSPSDAAAVPPATAASAAAVTSASASAPAATAKAPNGTKNHVNAITTR